jgi:hypothetical protein
VVLPLISVLEEFNLFLVFRRFLLLKFFILGFYFSYVIFKFRDLFVEIVDINLHLFALTLDLSLILFRLQAFSHTVGDRAFIQLLISLKD